MGRRGERFWGKGMIDRNMENVVLTNSRRLCFFIEKELLKYYACLWFTIV